MSSLTYNPPALRGPHASPAAADSGWSRRALTPPGFGLRFGLAGGMLEVWLAKETVAAEFDSALRWGYR
jgi:hypothetical protein